MQLTAALSVVMQSHFCLFSFTGLDTRDILIKLTIFHILTKHEKKTRSSVMRIKHALRKHTTFQFETYKCLCLHNHNHLTSLSDVCLTGSLIVRISAHQMVVTVL